MRSASISTLLLLCLCSEARAQEQFYVSASSVEALGRDLASVAPTIEPAKVPGGSPESYLLSTSCLGRYGPLGAYGPLGILGPIGDSAWNPSYWISAIGDWSHWAEDLADLDGPLSEAGPLGPNGPVSETQYYDNPLYDENHFAKQLQGAGVWTVLGPIGPLGALGPLGPLGPVGAHGYARDSDGSYRSGDAVVRTVSVPFSGGAREYELYEHYDELFARAMGDNDTSFMVSGRIGSYYESDSYAFTSSSTQLVTILVVPDKSLDNFDVTVLDGGGNEIATSNSYFFIDWVQVSVPAGTRLEARVHLASSLHYLSKTYRLFVTGSTPHLAQTDITGDHRISYSTKSRRRR